MAKQWYVKTKKGSAGPFSPRKLKEYASKGKIKPKSFIRLDENEWVVADSVKGLFPTPADAPTVTPEFMDQIVAIPEPTSHLIEIRERAYVKQFGQFENVSHPLGPGIPHIDVYVHPPTEQRPITTLVTGGMSDHAMPIPGNGPASPRCELLLYVEQAEELHIQLLRFLASMPYQQKTWFSYGSTVNNGNPPQPIFEGSVLDHYVFMFPIVGNDFEFDQSVSLEGSPLQLLHVEPITAKERQFIIDRGMDDFLGLLEKKQHSPVLNPGRSCYVSKKGWFGRK